MTDADELLWKTATSFADMCELTALYVQGAFTFFPGYAGQTAPETSIISTHLASYNRSGFMTTGSQPGEIQIGYKQRAWVEGFALRPTARKLARLSLYADLIVVVQSPGNSGGYQTPITEADFHPFTWAGYISAEHDVGAFEDCCSKVAFEVLCGACYVVIVDPRWGRNDYMWDKIMSELNNTSDPRYSPDPHPDLELDEDFLGLPTSE